MKFFSMMLAATLAGTTLSAQYKKASFLNKSGRTLEIGSRMSFTSLGNAVQPSVFIAFGSDDNDRRFFSWNSLEVLTPVTVSYNTTYTTYNDAGEEWKMPSKVTAKSSVGFVYSFNMGYYLLNNAEENNKLLPFVNVALTSMLHQGINEYTTDPYDFSPDKYPMSQFAFGIGGQAGAGVLYRPNDWLGLKLTGGYNGQYNLSDDNSDFFHYRNHPYASLSVRFKIMRDR